MYFLPTGKYKVYNLNSLFKVKIEFKSYLLFLSGSHMLVILTLHYIKTNILLETRTLGLDGFYVSFPY